jgi:hypothetical protein
MLESRAPAVTFLAYKKMANQMMSPQYLVKETSFILKGERRTVHLSDQELTLKE